MDAHLRLPPAAVIESWYEAALAAVDPAVAVSDHLTRDGHAVVVDERRVPVSGRLIVVGAGKAAVAMAGAAEDALGDLIDDGLVVTKDGHISGHPMARVRVVEAGHPIPDQRGCDVARAFLDLANGLTWGDVLLALISGGGSALMETPRAPVSLGDLAVTTDLLLRAGAPIQDLNAVRTPLSLIKGGGLRRAAGDATVVTLILSDVLGNDPAIIASGPTVLIEPRPDAALAMLDRYGVRDRVPETVTHVLSRGHPRDAVPPRSVLRTDILAVIADNNVAVAAAAASARAAGYRTDVIWSARTGEASDLGRAWVEACRACPDEVQVLLGGGEATVTVRGDGTGGRNTEFTLAAALELARHDIHEWTVASLATDGQDALTGVAGAIADAQTVERSVVAGVDPHAALERNDSFRVFEAAGGLVRPGPTGTNVNDLYFAVRQTFSPSSRLDRVGDVAIG